MYKTSEYVILNLFIRGSLNGKPVVASIKGEAHVVYDLHCRLRVGIDILAPEQIVIDFIKREMVIGSCGGVIVPLTITPKPNHKTSRPIHANRRPALPRDYTDKK